MMLGLKCSGCGAEYPADTLINLCPVEQRPAEIIIDLPRLQREQPDLAWYHPERHDLWRFGGLLPLDINHPEEQKSIVSLGGGYTPLLDYRDHPWRSNMASAWR